VSGADGAAPDALRDLVREVLRDLLPALAARNGSPLSSAPSSAAAPAARPAAPATRSPSFAPPATPPRPPATPPTSEPAPFRPAEAAGAAGPLGAAGALGVAGAASGSGATAQTVRLASDEDLREFVLQVLRLADNPKRRQDLMTGRLRFTLAAAGPAPALAEHRVEKGAVTERAVQAAARAGARLVLGSRAVLTPLARDRARALGVPIEEER
jgi:hypothetical protein